jgi:hypothetical protein
MKMKINVKIENKDVYSKTFEWDDELIKMFMEQLDMDIILFEHHHKWKKTKSPP